LAAAIEAEIGVEPTLIRGGGGVFDVTVDGERIFSKKSVGRFPEDEEILEQMRA
jgi:selenoprotein W-related protein